MKKVQLLLATTILMTLITGCDADKLIDGDVKVQNSKNSNTNIRDVFYRRSSSSKWGKNKLKNQELKPSQSKRYTIRNCNEDYDFKVVYLDDTVKYKKDYEVECYETETLVFRDN